MISNLGTSEKGIIYGHSKMISSGAEQQRIYLACPGVWVWSSNSEKAPPNKIKGHSCQGLQEPQQQFIKCTTQEVHCNVNYPCLVINTMFACLLKKKQTNLMQGITQTHSF